MINVFGHSWVLKDILPRIHRTLGIRLADNHRLGIIDAPRLLAVVLDAVKGDVGIEIGERLWRAGDFECSCIGWVRRAALHEI